MHPHCNQFYCSLSGAFTKCTMFADDMFPHLRKQQIALHRVKGKASPYSITARRVLEQIPVLGSQPAGDVSHKPDSRLPLLSAGTAVTPVTFKRAATKFAAW